MIYIVVGVVRVFILAMQFLMFARAILSWIMPETDNAIANFIIAVTEPAIAPVRALLQRFEFFNNLPIDISFIVSYVLLLILYNILPAVHI